MGQKKVVCVCSEGDNEGSDARSLRKRKWKV